MGSAIESLAWTIDRASREFGPNPRTIQGRLTRAGIAPDENGRYTTKQICAAVFGDTDGEKLRKLKEEADSVALDNARIRGELISVEDAVLLNRRVAFAIRQKILALPLPVEKRNDLLHEIQRLADVDFTKAADNDELESA